MSRVRAGPNRRRGEELNSYFRPARKLQEERDGGQIRWREGGQREREDRGEGLVGAGRRAKGKSAIVLRHARRRHPSHGSRPKRELHRRPQRLGHDYYYYYYYGYYYNYYYYNYYN